MSLPNVSTLDTRRNRIAVALANACLRLANDSYRKVLTGAVIVGIHEAARQAKRRGAACNCTPDYPDSPACSVHGYFAGAPDPEQPDPPRDGDLLGRLLDEQRQQWQERHGDFVPRDACKHWGHKPGEWRYSCCACSGIPNGCDNCSDAEETT